MANAFQVVVMGCTGGPREGNLSGYLLSPLKASHWIAFDAGTLLSGIEKALQKNNFPDLSLSDSTRIPGAEFLHTHLKAYLISHAHLDHIAALILNSQIDTPKPILGIEPTIVNIRDHIFNGRIWPNYGSEGVEPVLNRYHYVRLPLNYPESIPGTPLNVEAFLLSHPRGYPSTAFLIEYEGEYMLYFGDTSSDAMEIEKHLTRVWKRIAPLIQEGKFRGMLLECSYSHKEADQVVFGHLDPKLVMFEIKRLADFAQMPLQGMKVVVTHRKDSIVKGDDAQQEIYEELTDLNDLGIDFIYPEQGDRILL